MMLSLSEADLRELHQALQLHLTRMEQELSRTENRDYRHSLSQSLERLEGIQQRLSMTLETGDAVA